MAGYLRKYVSRYRVKAEYDLSTNDYPRIEGVGLDPSFDDLYIDCANKIKIKHGTGSTLSCYIPSKQRGMNVLRKIHEDKISKTLPTEKTVDQKKYLENLCAALVDQGVLVSAEVLDYEVYFEFSADIIDYIAKLVGAKTYGASISPFSPKNLPKTPYKIPEKDMKLYKEATKDFPTKTIVIQGKSRTIIDGLLVSRLTGKFDKIIIASQPKKFDINKDRKKKGLKGKEYIHSMGSDLWQQYCEFMRTSVEGGST